EVIRCIGRKLVLPGVEQFAAQQRNQRHGQQDQAESQRLAGSRQGMAQQLAQSQSPGQGCARQQASQSLERPQQQTSQEQRGQQPTTDQGQGKFQVQAQAPHDQAQREQCRAVDQPGAGRNRQHVAAQHPQRRNPTQGRQRR